MTNAKIVFSKIVHCNRSKLIRPSAALILTTLMVIAAATTVATAQTYTTLVNFDGYNGAAPFVMTLVQGADGNLYGTANTGGANLGAGTVFKVTPGGVLATLYNFCAAPDCTDGERPFAGLVLATDGSFYGTTAGGGTGSGYGLCGTVFRITPAGTLTTLYSFCSQANCTDGEWPWAALIQATDGNLYGTTDLGGSRGVNGDGTVFKITPKGTLTTLYDFDSSNGIVGADPLAAVVQGRDGNFYITTASGGASGLGTVFKISPSGTATTLHSFNGTDGASPYSGLIQATDGNFYGTTWENGDSASCAYGCGTIFRITPEGKLTTLHSFDGADGANPYAGLIQASDGNFYGTTTFGANSICTNGDLQGCGTAFKMSPEGVLTTLHSFDGTDGANPWGGLVQATNGTFYGTTTLGGTSIGGTVFSLDMGLGPFVSLLPTTRRVGQDVGILGQGLSGTTAVSFNGTPATFAAVSDTYLKAAVPSGAATGFVMVTTSSGTLTSNKPFRVTPVILSFSPTSGPVGTPVVITGTGLTQTTKVAFCGVPASSFTVDSDTQVTATVPAGAHDHIAITTAGGKVWSPGTFTLTP